MSVAATRFGHTDGKVGLVYGKNGEKVVTIGSDGEMRVWAGIDDDDCENHLIGDEGRAVCVSDKKIFVGSSGTNMLSGYNWDGDSEGVVGPRFTSDVTSLACKPSGEVVVAGCDDFSVKVINTTDFSAISLTGHEAPILSVALGNEGDVVASSSCDGSVKIWCLDTKSVIKTIPSVVKKSNDVPNSNSMCCISFSKCGQWFSVPTEQKVVLFGRGVNWEQTKEAKVDNLAQGEIVTSVDWSYDGNYILAGTNKGNLCLLSFSTMSVVKIIPSGRRSNICSLACHPSKNEAVFADMGGHWGLVEELSVASQNNGQSVSAENSKSVLDDDEDMGALFNDDDDDENSFSISRTVAETGYVKDDDGNLAFGSRPQQPRPDSSLSMTSTIMDEEAKKESHYRPPAPPKVRLQPPFQSGASPEGLSNRFLVYNSVGIVKSHSSDQESSLDVEFHDIAVHHALHLSNSEGATMAALSKHLLATATSGDDVVGGKLMVNYFSSSDVNKEWNVVLEEDEEIIGIAAGDTWVAVATNKNHLRMFTAGGIQREVVMISGPLVNIIGEADKLMVIVHQGHPLPGQQYLSYNLFTIDNGIKPINKEPLPLPIAPGSDLYWAGFSDTLVPCTADTMGWVRALDVATNLWHPIINTKDHVKGKSDFYYIMSVSHLEFLVRGVLCKGSKYPPTVPRPLPTALPLEVPLASTHTEKGGLEVKCINLSLQCKLLSSNPNHQEESEEAIETIRQNEVECLMKLFALACKSDHESRAIEVASLMPDVDTLQLAIKYAAKIRRVGLADKLGQLAMDLQERRDREEKENMLKSNTSHDSNDGESQDMFAPTQENPLLAAAAKRDSIDRPVQKLNISTQGRQETRNPFAKRAASSTPISSPSQGIVFDSIQSPSNNGTPLPEKSGFGQRKILNVDSARRPMMSKQPLIAKEKENKSDNNQVGEMLKGFQLFLAENKEMFNSEDQQLALSKWKSMGREEKEKFKEPRIPNSSKDNGKRKRSEDEAVDDSKKIKPSGAGTKQKLAGFAFDGKK